MQSALSKNIAVVINKTERQTDEESRRKLRNVNRTTKAVNKTGNWSTCK